MLHSRSRPVTRGLFAPLVTIAVLTILLLSPALVEAGLPQAPDRTTIFGAVQSTADGRPISGAEIRLAGSDAAVFTSPQGHFQLDVDGPGPWRIVVTQLGYGSRELALPSDLGGSGTAEDPYRIEMEPRPLSLAQVVVIGRGEGQLRTQVPASISRLDRSTIETVEPIHPAEVLNRVPGVWVSPTSGEGHMTAIRQPITTKPVYLFLEDGVPTRSPGFFNHNALYEVNVPQSDRMEVIRGPGTSLYGSDAIGGVIDVGTRPPTDSPTWEGRLEGTSLGFARLLTSVSDTWGDSGVRADLNVTRGDTWREQAEYRRYSATARWDQSLASNLRLRTTLTWSKVYQDDPSTVSEEELARSPEVNHHPIVFRTVDALRFSSQLERRTASSRFSVTPFLRWNRLDLMPSWMLNFDPVVYESGHRSLGLMTRYHRDLPVLDGRVVAGIDAEYSPGFREEDVIEVTRVDGRAVDWNVGERIYDYDATYRGVSPYVQVEVSPTEALRLHGGLRFDQAGFRYESALDPLQEGRHRRPDDTTVSYSNLGPSVGATLELHPGLNLFTAWRESFRTPSEGQLFRQGAAESTVDLRPVKARSSEIGARGYLAPGIAWEVSAYRLAIRDDILSFVRPQDGLRESRNAGRTLHRGVEVGLTVPLPGELEADVSASRASHRYVDWEPGGGVDYSGNEMEQAPRTLATGRLRAPLPFGGEAELEGLYMSEFWMNPENDQRYEGHTLLNFRARVPITATTSLSVRVLNLADRHYAERASHHPFRGGEYSPGKPRTIHVGLSFGGGS